MKKETEFYDTVPFVAISNSLGNVKGNIIGTSNADGSPSGEDFFSAEGENWSNLFGAGKNAATKQQGKATARTNRSNAKQLAAEAKKGEADAKIASAKSAEAIGLAAAQSATDQANAQVQIAALTPQGMSTGAKIGIGAGVLILLGVGGYFILKKKK